MRRTLLLLFLLGCLGTGPSLNGQSGGLVYELDTLFQGWKERDKVSGELMVSFMDSVIFHKADGYSDALAGHPLQPGMSFNLASLSKQFVAMAVMILKEERRLDYEEAVGYHLPAFPYRGITIRHLLTHTSGLPDYYTWWETDYPKHAVLTNKEVLEAFLAKHPQPVFEPGTQYQYSNTGYIVLAEVIAAVSGMPAWEFIEKRIIQPLDLQATFPYTMDMPARSDRLRVKGFVWIEGKPVQSDLFNIDGVFGDGNLYSSASDLLRWSQALRRHELVSPRTMEEAFRPQVLADGSISYYGFGWGLYADGMSVSHTGGWVGFRNFILRDIDSGYEVVFLSNSTFSNRSGHLESVRQLLARYRTLCIRDVEIADGSGKPRYPGAVRIQGDKVLEVGADVVPKPGDRVVSGKGKVLAPGFIDTHSHHDRAMFEKRHVPELLSQGITTIVVGQDGDSYYPLKEFWSILDSTPVAVNVATYVGHNTLRRKAMGNFTRRASETEISRMRTMLQDELNAGAIGLSTGLEYDPGIYSSRDEVLSLASVVRDNQARYMSHIRSEDRYLTEAIEEILHIGKKMKIPVQISHLKLAIVSQWGKADSLLQVLDKARKRGIEVTADVYPYEYWQSTMTVLFPNRDFDNPEAAHFALTQLTTPEGMFIARYEPDSSVAGKTLAQVAAERSESPETVYMGLIKKVLETQGDESVICTSMDSLDVGKLLAWPWTNICTDGTLNGTHPRGAGSFTKVLRLYQREKKLFSLEEAIRKMTALAASNVGFSGRGMLRPGYFADLVLLDPENVVDHATMETPRALSEGVLKVWVNGQEVWSHNQSTGLYPGVSIKRGH